MGARNRVGIGFVIPGRHDTWTGGINSLELIPRLLKLLQIRALLGSGETTPRALITYMMYEIFVCILFRDIFC
jgi:hypothetical protein